MHDSKFEEQKNIMNNSLSSTEDKIKAAEYILEHTPIPETTKVELVSNIKQDKAECTTTHLYESQNEILNDLRNLESYK